VTDVAAQALKAQTAVDQATHPARSVTIALGHVARAHTDSYRLLQLGQARDQAAHLRRYLEAALAALDEVDGLLG
jgi:hypothetical protein